MFASRKGKMNLRYEAASGYYNDYQEDNSNRIAEILKMEEIIISSV
jgi:hypothetical protein